MGGSIFDTELGYLVDSMTAHQRMVLQRLLGECLAPIPRSGSQSLGPETLPMILAGIEPLFSVLEKLRRLPVDDPDSDIRPFAFSIPEPGFGIITASPRINSWPAIWTDESHDWLPHANLGRLMIDLGSLKEITSATIAWLVTLARQMPNQKVMIRGASDSTRRSIQIMCLDEMLVCEVRK